MPSLPPVFRSAERAVQYVRLQPEHYDGPLGVHSLVGLPMPSIVEVLRWADSTKGESKYLEAYVLCF